MNAALSWSFGKAKKEKSPQAPLSRGMAAMLDACGAVGAGDGDEEQIVTLWQVTGKDGGGKIDFDKLVDSFGCQHLDAALIDRVARLPAHVFLCPGTFFAHWDLNDIPIKYLQFFLDVDDELNHIRNEYCDGAMLAVDVKQRLIEVLVELVERHQKARAGVTDEMVDSFMAARTLPRLYK